MKYLIRICGGPRCKENFSEDLFKEAKKIIGTREDCEIEKSGCMGLCHIGPTIKVLNQQTGESKTYNKVVPSEISKILGDLL